MTAPRSGVESGTPEGATRTLVVWCPDWPVVAAGAGPDEPAAVLHANRVVACSAAARAAGVRRGHRRREAQARCPEMTVLDHDPSRDARAFEPVVVSVEQVCPHVEVVRPGMCAFATRGPSRYFGGDEALAARTAGAAGNGAMCGVADGRFAAALAARVGAVVAPGGSRGFLAGFGVSELGRPDLADILRRLGVRALGDLAALPANSVLERFGDDGLEAHRLACGLDPVPLRTRTPPPDLAVSTTLDPPVGRVDVVAFAGKSLADDLTDKLSSLALACTRVAIEIDTSDGRTLSRLWRHDGALDAQAIAQRVRWQLDAWLVDETVRRRGVLVAVLRLVPDEVKPATGRQAGFWGGAAQTDERASRALARVQAMLGHESVVTAVLGGGRSPADRVRLVAWGDPREPARPGDGDATPVLGEEAAGMQTGGAGGREVPPWPGRIPPPAPATVHPEPVRADVVDEQGATVRVRGRGEVTAAPARMRVAGGAWTGVAAWAGPWPADERWWDPSGRRRRARFQIAGTDDVVVLACVEDGRWWVEAVYD